MKSNVLIVDETGKVLVRIRESAGVPLRDVHQKAAPDAEESGFCKLYYANEWETAPLAAEGAAQDSSRSVLLFDTEESLHALYKERLGNAGADATRVVLVRPGEGFEDLTDRGFTDQPAHQRRFRAALRLSG